MPKFIRKPVEIEAEQYFHGKPCQGVKVTNPEVIFSLSGKHFYVTHCNPMPRDWLSLEKKDDGLYEALPFAFYEVKSGERQPVSESNAQLVKLYTEVFQLGQPVPYAWIETIHKGQTVQVQEGDWIIPEPDGVHYYPCKPDVFEQTYERVQS
jgi:hypothetical protein